MLEIPTVVKVEGISCPLLAATTRQIAVRTDSDVTSAAALRPRENAACRLGHDNPVAQYTQLRPTDPPAC